RTNLNQLAALYRRAQVLVTTDSGPMHLAAAVGTSVVALFGPTAPWRTGPYGQNHVVLRAGIHCSPCFKKECLTAEYEKHACMKRISVDEVAHAVLEQLARAPIVASNEGRVRAASLAAQGRARTLPCLLPSRCPLLCHRIAPLGFQW